ncbi:MAG: hypothetical protein V4581_18140 [Bacteroidota bacterium]
MKNKYLKTIVLTLLVIALGSCRSNSFLHKDITAANYRQIIAFKHQKSDTLWLNKNTLAIKDEDYLEVGQIKNGNRKGKWYYYFYTTSDSLYCYHIKNYRKNDTITLRTVLVNRKYW